MAEDAEVSSPVEAARARLWANRPVLLDYDPAWPAAAAEAAAAILAACTGIVTTVEHVGSTAVPGLRAKPVLDLMPGFATFADGFAAVPAMESLGYEYRGEYGIPGRHYFTKRIEGNDHVWKHNVHAYEVGHPEWVRHLVFRDALRTNNAWRDEYAALKDELALRFPDDVQAYADAKDEFVERVIGAAGGPGRNPVSGAG